MVLIVAVNNLGNGQEIVLNFEVTGAVSPGDKVSQLCWQIDDHALRNLGFNVDANTNLAEFSFEITAADCPDVDTWYFLNIYAWDIPQGNDSAELTIESMTFKRIAPSVGSADGASTTAP